MKNKFNWLFLRGLKSSIINQFAIVKEGETVKNPLARFIYEALKKEIEIKKTNILTGACETETIPHRSKDKGLPFPLIRSVDKFTQPKSDQDAELKGYNIIRQTSRLPMVLTWFLMGKTGNRSINRWLASEYRELIRLKEKDQYGNYWKKYFGLMVHSKSFFIANLSSWDPSWYKNYSLKEVLRLHGDFVALSLNCKLDGEKLKEVWIESPRGKWRCLSVPSKSLRLYTHALNAALVFLLRGEIESGNHGFIKNKGSLSIWKDILENKKLDYENIVQLDVSSGFPNLHKGYVQMSLVSSGKLSNPLINHIMTLLSLPVETGSHPTEETRLEYEGNKTWREGPRGLPMGLGISPFLYTYTVTQILKQTGLWNAWSWANYADDLNLFIKNFQWENFTNRLQIATGSSQKLKIEDLYELLNNLPLFKVAGIQFNKSKYSLSKLNGRWLDGLSLVGLRFDGEDLYANTRGRGENPVTGRKSTSPQTMKLMIANKNKKLFDLNFNWLNKNQNYLGFFQAYLYNGGNLSVSKSWSKIFEAKSLEGFVRGQLRVHPHMNDGIISKCNMQNVCQRILAKIMKSIRADRIYTTNHTWVMKSEMMKYEWDYIEKGKYFKKYSELIAEGLINRKE